MQCLRPTVPVQVDELAVDLAGQRVGFAQREGSRCPRLVGAGEPRSAIQPHSQLILRGIGWRRTWIVAVGRSVEPHQIGQTVPVHVDHSLPAHREAGTEHLLGEDAAGARRPTLTGQSLSGNKALDAAGQNAVLDAMRVTLGRGGGTVTRTGAMLAVTPPADQFGLCGAFALSVPRG